MTAENNTVPIKCHLGSMKHLLHWQAPLGTLRLSSTLWEQTGLPLRSSAGFQHTTGLKTLGPGLYPLGGSYRVQTLLHCCNKPSPPAETVLGRAVSVNDSAVQWPAHTRETSGPARVTALPAITRRLSMIARRAKTTVAVRHAAESGMTRAISLLQLQAMQGALQKLTAAAGNAKPSIEETGPVSRCFGSGRGNDRT